LLVDAGAVIQPITGPLDHNGTAPVSIGGFVEKISGTELVGRSDFSGGWGIRAPVFRLLLPAHGQTRQNLPRRQCQKTSHIP
jgi:hypothetical protein